MNNLVAGGFAILLILHGLIHLMGATVYLKLGRIAGLPYKTTLLGGRWDLGERGMRAFGALWVVPTVGFVLAGGALMASWAIWAPLAITSALLSLVLTILDVTVAFAGAILNVVILAIAWLGPILRSTLHR